MRNQGRRKLPVLAAAGLAAGLVFSSAAAAYPHPGGVHSEAQLASAKRNIAGGLQPWADAMKELIPRADFYLSEPPSASADFHVPGYYEDPAGHTGASEVLHTDVRAAYASALAYRLTGRTAYAEKAKAILNDWAFRNTAVSGTDGPLVMTYSGVGFIHAAELLRDYSGWSEADKTAFSNWLTNVYLARAANPIKTRSNNWGDWGIYGAMAAYYYKDDPVLLNAEITRLKNKIDSSIAADGSMPHEAGRGASGLWYTYFALAPMTAAAQIAKEAAGIDLFQWTSPGGRTIKQALDYLLFYMNRPDQWPYGANPRMPVSDEEWGYNLFEAMSDYYDEPAYKSFASVKGPIMYLASHFAWNFPSVTKGGLRLVDEKFDVLTSTAAPRGWTVSKAANTSAVVWNTPTAADKSLKIWDTSTSGTASAVKVFPDQYGIIEAEWKFMYMALFPNARFGLKHAAVYAAELLTTASGLIYRSGTGSDIVLQTLSPDAWYTVKLIANPASDKTDVYVNGQLKASGVPFRSTVSALDRIEFAGGSGETGTFYIDQVKIMN
ncbi:alginate lyase family protein [Paenibacillus caseinilyticus]|uniref:Alginate lyase domain-containing protein n=1 Tax=Paenibacillus mucilaginosus K02 TaxID=997761 RepID=I0BHK7_9BACL|nr:alginate lyase family protein [Paenibacillus mucilaginosus]AFH61854.1 hypothetical protein B2K_14200 [Paenibacillus mucilaginosus K02]